MWPIFTAARQATMRMAVEDIDDLVTRLVQPIWPKANCHEPR